jgi:hypothetical protein
MHSKTSEEEMFLVVKEWQRSKLSQKQYCRERNLAYHRFHHYYRKFRDRQAKPVASGFVQIKASTSPFAEFSFPGGSRVIFHQPVSIEYLKGLAG